MGEMIANRAQSEGRGTEVEFHVVGHAPVGSLNHEALRSLATRPAETPLERAEFLARVADLDLVVMLHDEAHYAHTASGVLLDAVATERPLVNLPNVMIDHLATRHGDIGHPCADLEGIADYLAALTVDDLDGERFRRWRANVGRVARSRHPTAVGWPEAGSMVGSAGFRRCSGRSMAARRINRVRILRV